MAERPPSREIRQQYCRIFAVAFADPSRLRVPCQPIEIAQVRVKLRGPSRRVVMH